LAVRLGPAGGGAGGQVIEVDDADAILFDLAEEAAEGDALADAGGAG